MTDRWATNFAGALLALAAGIWLSWRAYQRAD